MSLERQPVQFVQFDLDYCTLTYGSAPCTASLSADAPKKCFNMYHGCQDKANFDKGTTTLTFGLNRVGAPKGERIYPALRSVSTRPIEINPGAFDDRTGPLGKRARITVVLEDFADPDTWLDKYWDQRASGAAQWSGQGYKPAQSGTFFGRLRARCPYYFGRAARVLEGYAGQALSSMRTRHYVISSWSGPNLDDGKVTVELRDVLDLAENDKAVCPKVSRGMLGSAMEEEGLASFDLQPEGIGTEYAADGRALIGSEIVRFERSGDTISVTARAMDGSTPASHDEGDLFQECYRVENAPIADVAEELLKDFAGVPASWIPKSDWDDESAWLAGFEVTATIPKPTGVADLLGELAVHGVFWWPDEVAQKIRMRANRPLTPDEELHTLTDAEHNVGQSLRREDRYDQRVTQVRLWHSMIDATAGAEDGKNYSRVHVGTNTGGAELEYGQERIVDIFSRWLGGGNDNAAEAIATRLANRFRDPPIEVEFKIDVKDRDVVLPADPFRLLTRAVQGDDGQIVAAEMQMVSVEEHSSGHALTCKGVSFRFSGRFGYMMAASGAPSNFGAATDDQKLRGCFMIDKAETEMSDGSALYAMF